MVDKEFKRTLADRFESWELAEFLQISTEDFIEMFEDDIEVAYEDLAEYCGLRGTNDEDSDDSRSE
jgi:hypothetical protein